MKININIHIHIGKLSQRNTGNLPSDKHISITVLCTFRWPQLRFIHGGGDFVVVCLCHVQLVREQGHPSSGEFLLVYV